jgi:hypothetical protein
MLNSAAAYQKLMLVAVAGVLALIFAPALLTGFGDHTADVAYSLRSYFYGLQMLLGCALLFPLGAFTLGWLFDAQDPDFCRQRPFTTVAVGLLILMFYVYLRSLLHHLLGLPITGTEIIALLLGCALLYARTTGLVFKTELPIATLISTGLFLLLCIALAQHELPRLIMLSSDPDQHGFFAAQIQKLGGVPFSRLEWANLPFGYPAGSPVLIFCISSVSMLSIANSTAIVPTLQAYLALFIICELLYRPGTLNRTRSYTLLGGILVYHYLMTYGLEQDHFHLEGYGRLSSLWLFALVMSVCLYPMSKPNTASALVKPPSYRFIIIGLLLLFVASCLHPINVFLTAGLLSLAFVAHFPRQSWQLGALVLLLPMLALDPYYLDLLTGTQRTATTALVNQYTLDLSAWEVVSATLLLFKYWLLNLPTFFDLPYLNGATLPVALLLFYSIYKQEKAGEHLFSRSFFLLFAVYLAWALLTAFFQILGKDSRLWLLFPYYQYSKLQYLYLLTLFMMIWLLQRLFFESQTHWRAWLTLLLLGYGLAVMQASTGVVNKNPRVDYCGSMGCFSSDDKLVLEASARLYQQSLARPDLPVPRLLIPNTPRIYGNDRWQAPPGTKRSSLLDSMAKPIYERWLMPRGGTRSAIFYDTLPLAFFYQQGDLDYTFDNYMTHVCQQLDIAWLKSRNIQYLFLPTDMLDACVADRDSLDQQLQIIVQAGPARLYQLYP